jgi:hypothetical protein
MEAGRADRASDGTNAFRSRKARADQRPHRLASQTRQDILIATPRNIGAPERAERQCMPLDFYEKKSRW